MRFGRLLGVVIGVTSLAAWAGVARADPRDHPLGSCAGPRQSLSVADSTAGTYRLGPFRIVVGLRRVSVQSDRRVLWSTVSGVPFVRAAQGTVQFSGAGGFYQVQAAFTRCWQRQRLSQVLAGRRSVGSRAPWAVAAGSRSRSLRPRVAGWR